MLIAEHRRAKVVGRATKARQAVGNGQEHALGRMKSRVHLNAANNAAVSEILAPESLEDKFQALESEDKVEQLLNEIKSRMAASA
jgi:phage shock protein A